MESTGHATRHLLVSCAIKHTDRSNLHAFVDRAALTLNTAAVVFCDHSQCLLSEGHTRTTNGLSGPFQASRFSQERRME